MPPKKSTTQRKQPGKKPTKNTKPVEEDVEIDVELQTEEVEEPPKAVKKAPKKIAKKETNKEDSVEEGMKTLSLKEAAAQWRALSPDEKAKKKLANSGEKKLAVTTVVKFVKAQKNDGKSLKEEEKQAYHKQALDCLNETIEGIERYVSTVRQKNKEGFPSITMKSINAYAKVVHKLDENIDPSALVPSDLLYKATFVSYIIIKRSDGYASAPATVAKCISYLATQKFSEALRA